MNECGVEATESLGISLNFMPPEQMDDVVDGMATSARSFVIRVPGVRRVTAARRSIPQRGQTTRSLDCTLSELSTAAACHLSERRALSCVDAGTAMLCTTW